MLTKTYVRLILLYIDERCLVVENRFISGITWLLKVKAPEISKNVKPAQFVMVKSSKEFLFDPLMRRAFAIADVVDDELWIYYDVYGKGTKALTQIKEGEYINILGALGKKLFPEKV